MTEKLITPSTLITATKNTRINNASEGTELSYVEEFDDILEVVGSFGRYQKWLLLLIFMPVSFFAAFTSNLFLFQMVLPDHWCHVPGRENTSLSVTAWHNLTRPRSSDTGEPSNCLMRDIQWTSYNGTLSYTVTNRTKECTDGWEFDTTQFSTTVATTQGWVCERGHYSYYTLSTSMAGNAVGTFLLPLLADKYVGRRRMFFVALTIHIVFTIPVICIQGAVTHMFFRFLQGLAYETNYLMPYIIFMEVIPSERRALAVMLSFIAWTFGMCSTALVAWLVPNWRYLSVISLVPSLLGFIYWKYLPESPRWLLAKGKVVPCADILLQIGAVNGASEVSRVEVEAQLRVLVRRQPVDQPFTAMLAYPKLTTRAIMLFIMSFLQFVVYTVAMLSMTVLSNSFLAHFVLSVFELPSNFLSWGLIHYFGRRFMAYITFLLLAVSCFAAPFCIQNESLLLMVLGFAKLFSTSGLFIVFLMASEVLPTPIRTSGTGITIVFGMLGMVMAPHVLHSGLGEAGPYWILLGLTMASALAVIPLPETLGLQLPQTFQDAEELGQGRPFTSWVHHWNLHRFPQPPRPPQEEQSQDL